MKPYSCAAAKLYEDGPRRYPPAELHQMVDDSLQLVTRCVGDCKDEEKRAAMLSRAEQSAARQHAEIDDPSLIDWPAWIDNEALVFAMVEVAKARRAARQ